jgi:hypothetical protein
MHDNVFIGTMLTNADMDDTMDSREMIQHFFNSYPGIKEWCQTNLTAMDEHKLTIWPNTWGRYHTEWTVALRNLSQTEYVAARLRFA